MSSRLDEERGTCYLALGKFELAAEALSGALEQTGSPRRRGSLLTDLASVGIHRQDPDEVLLHSHAALDLAEQSRSPGYVGRKLHTLRSQLEPMLADRRIGSLHERISCVLATT
ncbi:hypothetical protein [Actinoplanes couchii]|uniref:Tetratricopeptide repeat protein n=1 Tax=Actinoplanes couchii TaxID=403638 RepID=A0ABQ3XTG2_9ACTN|nr:hypothetical protein [Actinoplanes couchii]MDR6318960.1 hypothetical protein [Actinoplanes couchii]GID61809.1 hypothetical protein Aco03nite_102130 [Actinoplanes couchii]